MGDGFRGCWFRYTCSSVPILRSYLYNLFLIDRKLCEQEEYTMAGTENPDERLKKLFVGGLNRLTSDDELKRYFETYGDISDSVVIRDLDKKSRGFGYVTFENAEHVRDVLNDKNSKGPHVIGGKEVEVKRAIPRDDQSSTAHLKTKKIFIGGLKDEATADDIKTVLSEIVRSEPTSVDLIMRKGEDGAPAKHRGFCFVEFENEDLVDELCCIKRVDIGGKKVEIKKAEPKEGGRGSQGRGGGRGGYRGGRGGGGGGGGGGSGGYGGYQHSGYDQSSYMGYSDPSYAYAGYGNSGYGYDAYGGLGTYQQTQSAYGPQNTGFGRGGGRGGGRFRPY